MANFCDECGHALNPDARFCGACGHPLPGPAATSGPAPTPAPGPAPTPAPEPTPPPAPEVPPAPTPPPAAAPVASPVASPVPPATPPPAPPPKPLAASGGAGAGGGRPSGWLLALLGLLVVAVGAVAVALFLGGGSDDTASKADREVLLESAASAGPAPFTPDIQPVAATVPTTVTTAPAAVPATTGKVAQGPFGGTGDNTLCDRDLLVEFLTNPANARIAQEWARVLDIEVRDIPTYVRSLIPTTLTADARVTNHTFENGRAVGYQAVLQRGTAVLVDTNGRLIARCRCGNPLLPPQEIAKPVYTGPKWEGFDPTVIVVVVPSPTPIYPPGGVGTLPQSTTPTTGRTTTTFDNEEDAAIRRIREAFEACLRSSNAPAESEYIITADELEQIIASARYTATLTDQRTGTWQVTITIPDQTLPDGDLTGGSATWEVNLSTGEVTPLDANAQESAATCADLA